MAKRKCTTCVKRQAARCKTLLNHVAGSNARKHGNVQPVVQSKGVGADVRLTRLANLCRSPIDQALTSCKARPIPSVLGFACQCNSGTHGQLDVGGDTFINQSVESAWVARLTDITHLDFRFTARRG